MSVTDEEKVLADEARSIMRNRFLTDEFINSCIETLISKYMLLSPSDLEKWEEDPEGWAGTVESENWEFELRVKKFMFCRKNHITVIVIGPFFPIYLAVR